MVSVRLPTESSISKSSRESSSTARMRSLLEQFPNSGVNVKEFCRRNNVNPWQFYYWRKRLGFRLRKGRRRSSAKVSAGEFCSGPEFVRLSVEKPMSVARDWAFEVNFPNGTVFRGTEGLALKALDRVRQLGR